ERPFGVAGEWVATSRWRTWDSGRRTKRGRRTSRFERRIQLRDNQVRPTLLLRTHAAWTHPQRRCSDRQGWSNNREGLARSRRFSVCRRRRERARVRLPAKGCFTRVSVLVSALF